MKHCFPARKQKRQQPHGSRPSQRKAYYASTDLPRPFANRLSFYLRQHLLLHPAPSIRISSSDSLWYGSIRLVSKTEIHGLAYMSEEEEMSLERQEISDNKPELTVDYLSVNTEKRNFVT